MHCNTAEKAQVVKSKFKALIVSVAVDSSWFVSEVEAAVVVLWVVVSVSKKLERSVGLRESNKYNGSWNCWSDIIC